MGDAKWNPETKTGTYNDKIHSGELRIKTMSEVPQDIKDKIASYVYKAPEIIKDSMIKDIEFGYSLSFETIEKLESDNRVLESQLILCNTKVDELKADNLRLSNEVADLKAENEKLKSHFGNNKWL